MRGSSSPATGPRSVSGIAAGGTNGGTRTISGHVSWWLKCHGIETWTCRSTRAYAGNTTCDGGVVGGSVTSTAR